METKLHEEVQRGQCIIHCHKCDATIVLVTEFFNSYIHLSVCACVVELVIPFDSNDQSKHKYKQCQHFFVVYFCFEEKSSALVKRQSLYLEKGQLVLYSRKTRQEFSLAVRFCACFSSSFTLEE